MPKLVNNDMNISQIPGLKGYTFSGVRPEKLGASEYTLVSIVIDTSSSVYNFRDILIENIKKAVDGCRKSPRANNILIRTVTFNSQVDELHGFKPLSEIDNGDYDSIHVGGNTSLYDATASSIGAMGEYGKNLADQDFSVNGIVFILTDGIDNNSTFTPKTVKEKVSQIMTDEIFDSCITVLIGLNTQSFLTQLNNFKDEANLTAFIDAGTTTPGNLAKLAAFVSRSVSSQANNNSTSISLAI